MTQVTINLPDTLAITRANATVHVATDKLSAEIIARLVEHGFGQKIGDAAAGSAKNAAEANMDETEYARGVMSKVIDQLVAGTWGASKGGGGLSDEDRARVFVADQLYRKNYATNKEKLAELDALKDDAAARNKRLLEVAAKAEANEKLADAFKASVAERVAHVIEQRKLREEAKAKTAAMVAGETPLDL